MHTLGAVSTRFSDGPFGSNLKSEHYVEAGVRVIRLQNIGVDEFIDTDKVFISKSHFDSLRKHTCLPGDILIGTLGDPNLRAVIQPIYVPIALNKADCVQMRVNKEMCTPEYVCTLLNCRSTVAMAQDKILGQTRLRISMGRLRQLSVPIPPVDLQRSFAARVAEIENLKAMRHPEFGDDLARDLFREHVKEPEPSKSITELSQEELSAFQAAVAAHEEAAARATKAKAALKKAWFKGPIAEARAIGFLEKSYSIFDEYGDGNYSNDYFNRVDRFLVRYNLRYDLRRPLTLHPTLAGIFYR